MARRAVEQLIVELGLDPKQYNKELRRVERVTKAFARDFDRIGRSLTRNVTLPVAAVGVGVVKMAEQYQRSMNRVQALTNDTAKGMAKLERQTKQMGRTTIFSARDVADAQAFLAQTGFKTNQILATIPGTLDLAAAGFLDLGQAADIASNILKQFQLPATLQQMNRVADTLAKTAADSNTNILQLQEALKLAGPTAAIAGQSLEDTASAIGKLGDAGIQGGLAGTAVNRFLLDLIDIQPQAREKLDELGIVFQRVGEDGEKSLLPIVEILKNIEESAVPLEALGTIFETRSLRALFTLLAQGSDELRTFRDDINKAVGTANRMQSQMAEGLPLALRRTEAAIVEMSVALADAGITEIVTSIALALTRIAKSLTELEAPTRRLILALAVIVAAAGPVVLVLKSIVQNVGLLAAAIIGLVGAPATGIAAIGVRLATWAVAIGSAGFAAKTLAEKMGDVADEVNRATRGLRELNQDGQASLREALFPFGPKAPGAVEIPTSTDEFPRLGPAIRIIDSQELERQRRGLVALQKEEELILRTQDELEIGLKKIAAQSLVLGSSFDVAQESADLYTKALSGLAGNVDMNRREMQQWIKEHRKFLAQLAERKRIEDQAEAIREYASGIQQVSDQVADLQIDDDIERQVAGTVRALERLAIATGFTGQKLEALKDTAAVFGRELRRGLEAEAERTRIRQAAEAQAELLRQPFLRAAESIQDSFADAFSDIFRGSVKTFEDLGNRILDIMADVAGQIAALMVVRPVISQLFGEDGTTGLLGGLFDSSTSQFQSLGPIQGPAQAGFLDRIFEAVGGGVGSGSLRSLLGGALGAGIGIALGIGGGGSGTGKLIESIFGAGGGILGSLFGPIGSILGALLGNIVGGFASKASDRAGGSIFQGGDATQVFAREGGVGRVGLGFVNSALFGPTPVGGVAGAQFALGEGVASTVIGTIQGIFDPIGALFASIGVSLFAKRTPKTKFTIGTDFTGAPSGGGVSALSPFGTIGAFFTQRIKANDLQRFVDSVADFDQSIANFLTPGQVNTVSAALAGTLGQSVRGRELKGKDFEFVFERRGADILRALGVPDSGLAQFGISGGRGGFDTEAFFTFFQRLPSLAIEIRALGGEVIPQTELALQGLREKFAQLSAEAPAFGFSLDHLTDQLAQGRAKITSEFERGITIDTLRITDPLEAALLDFERVAEERLANARAAGADLVAAEHLNYLQRIEILNQANQPILDLLDAIEGSAQFFGVGAALDVAQGRLADALEANDRAAAAAAGGEIVPLLREAFGSTPEFFSNLEQLQERLGSILVDIPAEDQAQQQQQQTELLGEIAAREDDQVEHLEDQTQLLEQLVEENKRMRQVIERREALTEKAL
jgi:TP901 family phage tail tape measure protein